MVVTSETLNIQTPSNKTMTTCHLRRSSVCVKVKFQCVTFQLIMYKIFIFVPFQSSALYMVDCMQLISSGTKIWNLKASRRQTITIELHNTVSVFCMTEMSGW